MIIKDITLSDVDYHKFTDFDFYHNSCLSYMTIYYILGNGTIEIDEFVDMMKDKANPPRGIPFLSRLKVLFFPPSSTFDRVKIVITQYKTYFIGIPQIQTKPRRQFN